jgi:hypothetical protein
MRLTSRNRFITHEETCQVVVRMECIHNLGKLIALGRVPLRSALVDLRVECIKIQPDVDTSVLECLHTIIMLALGVDMVHADRVDSNRLHERSIGGALRRSDERVIRDQLVRDAYENY